MPKKTNSESNASETPAKASSSAGGRSILVVDATPNSSGQTVTETSAGGAAITPGTSLVVNRTAKTIQPLGEDAVAGSVTTRAAAPAEPTITPKPVEASANLEVQDGQSAPGVLAPPALDTEAAQREAETAQAAAAEARAQELEALVASGKYAVPINAVHRKQSHLVMFGVTIFVLLLLVGVDVLADANVVNLPASVPHTHFISP